MSDLTDTKIRAVRRAAHKQGLTDLVRLCNAAWIDDGTPECDAARAEVSNLVAWADAQLSPGQLRLVNSVLDSILAECPPEFSGQSERANARRNHSGWAPADG